jgi:nucleotide-binding universal stress UspA family protein
MIVAMAVVTTLAMPPMLRWSLSRLPLRDEERVRLEREAFEAAGFVTNLERLLLVVDDSSNGKLAFRFATLLAQSRGLPLTVLHLDQCGPIQPIKLAEPATPEETTAIDKPRLDRSREKMRDVTLRFAALPPEAAVTKEARKGYDLLVIGVEKTMAPHGGFHDEIARIAAGFAGPLALVVARGAHIQQPQAHGLNILTPVRGNKVSRRGAEVALALARAGSSRVTALYVLGTVGLGAAQRRLRRPTATRRHEEGVLKDIVALAESYTVPIRTALRLDPAPEDAILRQARLGRYDLIVMGVGRPAGKTLFFGKIAAAVVENSQQSILFVTT